MMERVISSLFPLHGFSLGAIVILSQILASYIVNVFSYETLYRLYPHFRSQKWEKNGEIYQKIFRVRSWKEYIPAIGSFDKKHLSTEIKNDYLTAYLLESLRAELCHAFSLLFGIIICLFTQGRHADFLIMLWLLALNMPCIIIQRYNRPRFERIINRPRPDAPSGMVKFWLMEEPEEISNQGRT